MPYNIIYLYFFLLDLFLFIYRFTLLEIQYIFFDYDQHDAHLV